MHNRRQFGREARQCAKGAVYVEPERLGRTEVSQRVQVVSGTAIDGASGANHTDGAHAGGAVGRNGGAQGGEVHPHIRTDGNLSERGAPHSKEFHPLLGPRMHFDRGVDGEARLRVQPLGSHVKTRLRVPRHRETQDVRHRAATDQQPARRRGHPHQLGEPGDHLQLHQLGRLIQPRQMRIHAGGEHVGHHTQRGAVALDPAPEPGVSVAIGEGENLPHELLVGHFRGLSSHREGLPRQRGSYLTRNRLPGARIGQVANKGERVVHHAVGEGSKGVPVLRVEGGVGVVARKRHQRTIVGAASMGDPTASGPDGRPDGRPNRAGDPGAGCQLFTARTLPILAA